MALNGGDQFESFEEFEVKLKAFQASGNVLFSRKSSKKLPSYHPDAERLQYQFVHYECKQGKKRATASKGIRPNQRTLKLNCDAYIRISTFETGGKSSLKITGANHCHNNHPVDAMTAAVYPENRKPVITETVKALVSANVGQRQLKQYLEDSQSVCLLSQDVANLKRKLTGGMVRLNDIECVEKVLENVKKEGGFTKFGKSENGEFEYVFFMSSSMKRDLDSFCDVFVMDVTYKVNRYLYPLVNVLCVDAECGGRPVLHGFVRNESRECLTSCLSFLKSVMSEDVRGPSVFFVDKDLSELAAIHEAFPAALVRLCSFHSSIAVKRALTSHGLSSQQVDVFLDYFKEQRDTRSQERFRELTDIIQRDAPDKTVQYFRQNWWNIVDIWAAHAVLDLQKFHVTATNHVESYHSKIKQTLHPQTRLTDCISTLLTYNSDLVRTKDLNSHLHNITRHYNVTQHDKDLESITDFLTSYAGRLITDQYQLDKKITYTHTQTPSTSNLRHATKLIPCQQITNTQERQYRIVSTLTNRMNAVYQMMGEEQFNHRIEQLEDFFSLVTADKVFSIVDMTVDGTGIVGHSRRTETISGRKETETSPSDETVTETPSDRTETETPSERLETETSSDRTERETASSDLPSCRTVTSSDLTLTSFASVQLQKVKTCGRPRNSQNFARRKRRRIDNTMETNSTHDILTTDSITDFTAAATTLTDDMTPLTVNVPINTDCKTGETDCPTGESRVDIVESICHKCGEEELDRSLCVNGVMEWVRCKDCPRWYHKYCMGSEVRFRTFVCSFCLPGAILRMKEMSSDCKHNVSNMSDK